MTNLEYIRTLDAEKMVEMLLSEDCPYCIGKLNCRGDLNCNEGVLAWLQQEHIEEPKLIDSNKLINDIECVKFCNSKYCNLFDDDVCGVRNCRAAITNYIKAMEGASDEM